MRGAGIRARPPGKQRAKGAIAARIRAGSVKAFATHKPRSSHPFASCFPTQSRFVLAAGTLSGNPDEHSYRTLHLCMPVVERLSGAKPNLIGARDL